MISLINSIASLTIRNSSTLEEAGKTLRARLDALGAAQTALGAASSATIGDVAVAALRAVDFGRIELSGPPLLLTAEQVQGLSLLLYELATNAVKYGSLSNEEGRVLISWSLSGGRAFTFRWKETSGPAVVVPSLQGFGSTLVNRGIGMYFNGEVEQEFLPEGVQVRLSGWLKGDLNRPKDLEFSSSSDLAVA